jgi:two-component system copper resistance phosphate regulon response regulator CusR
MRVLLLEDEPKVRGFLLDGFEREGFATISFSVYQDLRNYLGRGEPPADVAILDRMVGDKDGADLIPLFKRHSPGTKILILSAINDPEERARILDLGADDYQGKPYSLSELLSRIRALFRRSHEVQAGSEKTVIFVGDLEIHLLDHEAKVKNFPLELTPKEFKLLSLLAREPGKIWSKFRLLDLIWQINLELESNVVEVTVRNLRKKLDLAGSHAVINSRRNMGYWIEA